MNEENIDRLEKGISALSPERVNEENIERVEKAISAVLKRE